MNEFRFKNVRQISKTVFVGEISKEDHYCTDGRCFTRPRVAEILFSSYGKYIVKKKNADVFPHQITIKMLGKTFKPKFSGLYFLIYPRDNFSIDQIFRHG